MKPAPLTPTALAAANLSGRPGRTLLLVGIVAVFSLLLFTGAMLAANWQAGVSSLSARLGADLLVVPQGQGKKIENVLLRAEPSAFLLNEQVLEAVRKVPDAVSVTPQLFISSLDAQCCSVKVQLIGLDWASDFVVKPWLTKALLHPLADDEIIVGNYIVGEIGTSLTFYDTKFKIVGQLSPSGMGFDSSVFMTLAAARKLAEKADPARTGEIEQSVSAVLVRVRPGVDPLTVSDGVLDNVGLKGGVNFVFASALMSDTASKFRQLTGAMVSMGALLWVIATAILFTVFSFAYQERAAERAVLRAMGASLAMIRSLTTREAVIVGVAGAVTGILLGSCLFSILAGSLADVVGLPGLTPGFAVWSGVAAVVMLVSVATPLVASRVILWRNARRDITAMIQEG